MWPMTWCIWSLAGSGYSCIKDRSRGQAKRRSHAKEMTETQSALHWHMALVGKVQNLQHEGLTAGSGSLGDGPGGL